jgi:hypothetical protein
VLDDGAYGSAVVAVGSSPVVPWILALAAVAAGCAWTIAMARLVGGPDDQRAAGSGLSLLLLALVAATGLALGLSVMPASPSPEVALASRLGPWILLGLLGVLDRLSDWRVIRPRLLARAGRLVLTPALLATACWVAVGTGAILPADTGAGPGSTWVGALGLASSVAMGLAATGLTAQRLDGAGTASARHRLGSLLGWTLVVQAALLAGGTLALGPAAELVFGSGRACLLPLVIVPLGLVLPGLILLRSTRGQAGVVANLLVLAGAVALRFALDGLPVPLLAYPY